LTIIPDMSLSTADHATDLPDLVYKEQLKLLCKQTPIVMLGEGFGVAFLCAALWNLFPQWLLMYWTLFILCTSILGRGVLAWLYQKTVPDATTRPWTFLFVIVAFCSGIGWGIAGSVFVNTPDLLHQTFVVFILLGVTAAASTYYSVISGLYAVFLLPAILPFTWWLFAQGENYIVLGIGGIIYIVVMLTNSYYSSNLLKSTLELQVEIRDLDFDNKLMEKKILARTAALEKALDFTKSTLESTTDGIIMVDNKGIVDYFNHTFMTLWQITKKHLAAQPFESFIQLARQQLIKPDDFLRSVKKISVKKSFESFNELHLNNGKIFECYSKPHWHDGEIIGHVWNFRDVTVRNKLAHRANHDHLTDLPNRSLLYDRIEQGIVFAKRRHTHLTVLFIDLDDFKIINDTLGHESGDLLLKEIAQRLKGCIRGSDTVSRFGGDEFVLLLQESEQTAILQLTQTILKRLTEPVKLTAQDVTVTASIGISMYPKDGTNAMALLKNADMAMYLAKKRGRNNFQFYNELVYQQSIEQLKIQTELYDALVNNEFFIEYQPIISLKEGTVIGAEALVRWQHPTKGVLYPGDFIKIAETNGLINQLGSWIFREACQQIKRWNDAGLYIGMAINISRVQIKNKSFSDVVEKSLHEFNIDPQYFELEFTEKAIMENIDQIKATLSRFNKMGIQMAIDDFGMGYSSINYLKAFPINKLKIDQSFIHNCVDNPDKLTIIKTIISMSDNLNLGVLAEGVETREELKFLKDSQCDEAQGNLFSPAVSAGDFPELVKRGFKHLLKFD